MDPDRRRAEDEYIAIRCQLGERAAYRLLVERFDAPLTAHARRLFGVDSEDVVQDIWLRVIRQLPSLRDPTKLRSFIFGIAHRAAADRFRKDYRDAERRFAMFETPEPDAAQNDAPFRLEAEEYLDALPANEREVVALVHGEGFTMAETADITGLPVGTVKSRLHRARANLARIHQENDQ